MESIPARRWLSRYGRYGIGLIALIWLFSRLDWMTAISFLGTLSLATVVALVMVSVVGYLCVFFSWHVLFRQFHLTRFVEAASVSLSLAFLNLSLPSRLPSTMVNPFLIAQRTDIDGSEATAITIFHTTLFAGCYGAVTFVGIASGLGRFPEPLVLILVLAAVTYLGVWGIGFATGYGFTFVDSILNHLRSVPVVNSVLDGLVVSDELTRDIQTAFRKCARDPSRIVWYVLAWSGGIVLASGARIWLLFRTAGLDFTPLILLPVFIVTAYAITILPISVGGIGVAEVSATLVFTSLGLPLDIVAPIVLVDRFFGGYLPGLLGLYPTIYTDFSDIKNNW